MTGRSRKTAQEQVEHIWTASRAAKSTLERIWAYSLAFVNGYHYHRWSDREAALVPRTQRQRRIRETRNFCSAHVDRVVAASASINPRLRGLPATSDIEDEFRAKTATSVLEHYWRLNEMPSVYLETMLWAAITGTGVIKVSWDPCGGKSFCLPEFIEDEDGQPLAVSDQLAFEGEIVSEAVSPFQIHVDPFVRHERQLEEILQAEKRTMEWLWDNFPDAAKDVAPDGGEEGDSYGGRVTLLDLINPATLRTSSQDRSRQEWVTLKHLWKRPCRDFPRGRYVLTAGSADVVLRDQENPIPEGHLPFLWFRDLDRPGRIWGQASLEHLISPQRNYNRLVSQYIEHIVKMVHAKVLWPSGSGLPESSFVAEVGEILEFNPPSAPAYLEPPTLPHNIDAEILRVKQDMDEIVATYGPEKGLWQGRASGKAINLLIEQGQRSKEPRVVRNAQTLERWGKLVLLLAKKYVTEDRLIRIHGQRGAVQVQYFTGADLGDNTDVVVDLDSMRPRSRELAMDWVERMIRAGMLNPQNPEDRAYAYKQLDLEDDSSAIEDKNQHRYNAQLEDELMFRGQAVPPHQWFQDVDAHAAQHTSDMNSDRFRSSPPAIQALFHEHMKSTMAMAMPIAGVTLQPGQREVVAAEEATPPRNSQED